MTGRRILLDENISPLLAKPLSTVYQTDRFDTAERNGLRGIDDVDLITHIGALGFQAIITHDAMQLVNPNERAALRDAGLHWIGVPRVRLSGMHVIAAESAITLVGIGHVFASWDLPPTAFYLHEAVDHSRITPITEAL